MIKIFRMKLEFEKKEKITSKDFKNQVYENKYIRKEKNMKQ